MHPNYCQITILLVVDLCSSLAYFMVIQPLPIAGKLPIKTLVARQLPTRSHTCTVHVSWLIDQLSRMRTIVQRSRSTVVQVVGAWLYLVPTFPQLYNPQSRLGPPSLLSTEPHSHSQSGKPVYSCTRTLCSIRFAAGRSLSRR